MSPTAIVSYDGTSNDDDALALAGMLARAGLALALAYVRHWREFDAGREELAEHDARRRLEHGILGLGVPEVTRHVVLNPSTGAGLGQLAEELGAEVIVFGSDYRTTPGHVEPGASARGLLEGGAIAIAVAQAGLRAQHPAAITKVAATASDSDRAPGATAQALAAKLGAEVVEAREAPDLLVVGSHASAPAGRVALSGPIRTQLNSARSSVLVVPRERPLAL